MTEPTKMETAIAMVDGWLQRSSKKLWKWIWASHVNSSGWHPEDTSQWKRPGLMMGIILLIFQTPGTIKGLATVEPVCGAWIIGLLVLPFMAGIFLWLCYWTGRAVYLITEKIKELCDWLGDEWGKARDKVSKK